MKTPVIKKLHSDAFVGGGRRWFTLKAAALSEGYSADSIAVNMGISKRELEALERAVPAPKLTEPKHGFSRCAGELA